MLHDTGALTYHDSISYTGGSHLALAHVSGYGTQRDIYALAFLDETGRLAVESYEMGIDHGLTRRGLRNDTFGEPIAADGSLAISAYEEGGIMIAIQPTGALPVQRYESWALDASGTSTSITPSRITSETFAEDGLHAMCRAPDDAAEGDFLVATGNVASEGLRLRAFRSGPR